MATKIRNISTIFRSCKSSNTTSSRNLVSKRNYADKPSWPPEKLRLKMELFQRDDGVPVYIKGGFGDRILFGLTCFLSAVGVADGLYMLVCMVFPRKKN